MFASSTISRYFSGTNVDIDKMLKTLLGNIKYAIEFAEYIYLTNGIYRAATERVAKYFVTDLSYGKIEAGGGEDLKQVLEETLAIKTTAGNILVDLLVYGNSFTVLYLPFKRNLICKKCHTSFNIEEMDFTLTDGKFTSTCHKCNYKGEFIRDDVSIREPDKINIVRLDPKQVEIDYDPISGQTEYFLKIDPELKRKILENDKHIISRVPWVIYEVAKKDNEMVKFEKGKIFHMKTSGLSGLSKGWGIPQSIGLTEYFVKQHYYSKAELAILKDFIIPKRILYPAIHGANDPMDFLSSAVFSSEMENLVDEHRKDPTKMMTSPFPIGYQAIGGEAKALSVTEELDFNTKQILAALGYPAELYYMSFNINVLPASLRLFENLWSHIPAGLNSWLKWIVDRISSFLNIPDMTVKWQGIRIADDIERRQILLSLAGSQQVSLATALEQLGIDLKDELEKLISQAALQKEVIEEAAEEEKIKMQLLGDEAGGGQGGTDPQTQLAQAAEVAQAWLQMDETSRRTNMHEMLVNNRILHDLSMAEYESLKSNIRRQGGSQAIQQARQGGTPGAQMGQAVQ